ncbi:hypothetical protein [Jiella sonneratiae]|uniref:GNAT family N-acetyltransferase n=1 Tax=Jiella sonneratiae TaxID=2816856 RepID=A0ABS3J8Y6_9HYPH|nr:hypothetical protein [Jiella sonneratiae]MBO0906125.1 hypothetical protein [Jiella sonneratiae]
MTAEAAAGAPAGHGVAAGSKAGRKAFGGIAPKGHRIRMMEPGEAEALLSLRRAGHADADARLSRPAETASPSLCDFVEYLVTREIFVCEEKKSGAIAAYAAASALFELYLVEEIVVGPDHAGSGADAALIRAVTRRARWFHHRAVAVLAWLDSPSESAFYDENAFMKVSRKHLSPNLQAELETRAGRFGATGQPGLRLRWL